MSTETLSHLPLPVRRAAEMLHEAGERAWLVGGATRDLLLGRPVKDFDFVIAGDALHWARRIADALGGAFVPLDEERNVGRVVITHDGQPLWIDVARFRAPEGEGDAGTLEADLRLRDFSVNAIAIDPLTGVTVDPTGGIADLREGILRLSGPRAFEDDPLRLLRAVRLHASHDLAISQGTWQAMQGAAPALRGVAAERVREEWLKLLAPRGALARVELLDQIGVLELLLPELVRGKGVHQSPPHSQDVFEHSLLVLDAMERLLPWEEGRGEAGRSEDSGIRQGPYAGYAEQMAAHLRRAVGHELPRWLLLKHVALLHDVGKPVTRSVGE
ncbi:MAG: hypothetical protein ACRDIB_05110, partial [Ardenticatenaceae bacterium]